MTTCVTYLTWRCESQLFIRRRAPTLCKPQPSVVPSSRYELINLWHNLHTFAVTQQQDNNCFSVQTSIARFELRVDSAAEQQKWVGVLTRASAQPTQVEPPVHHVQPQQMDVVLVPTPSEESPLLAHTPRRHTVLAPPTSPGTTGARRRLRLSDLAALFTPPSPKQSSPVGGDARLHIIGPRPLLCKAAAQPGSNAVLAIREQYERAMLFVAQNADIVPVQQRAHLQVEP